MSTERRIWGHWQNLSRADGPKGNWRLPVNGRAWLYVFAWTFHCEWNLWGRSCRLGVDLGGDEDTALAYVAFPPVAFYAGFRAPWKSRVRRLLPDETRRCNVAIHDWAVWVHPWDGDEWRRSDPWWKRGVTIHVLDILGGRRVFRQETTRPPERVVIRMDGFDHHGEASFERQTWKRPRWFAHVRETVTIQMDPGHGLPFAGKGENSWDCGDDAICGWSVEGDDVQACITHGIVQAVKARGRYGEPSRYAPETVTS